MSVQTKVRAEEPINWFNSAKSKINTAAQTGLVKAAEWGLEDSQRIVPVRTGFLKRSGSIKEQTPERVTYGYDAYYAGVVEFGSSRRPARPYVTPGYRVLSNGLAADFVYQALNTIL